MFVQALLGRELHDVLQWRGIESVYALFHTWADEAAPRLSEIAQPSVINVRWVLVTL